MRGYPKVGSYVRVKATGEIRRVKRLWKPGRVMFHNGEIFYLRGVMPVGPGRETLAAKLHPNRFTAMSGCMAAIIGGIIGEKWTDPAIAELAITADGFVLAMHEGDIGHNDFIGSVEDLERNITTLLDVAELTVEERQEFDRLYNQRVTDWRRVRA